MTNHLILGPSLGTSSFVWSMVGDPLSAQLTVTNFELPGHGPQIPATGPLGISDVADQVIELADTLGIDRFHYAGISLCGAVGLDLALRYPDRLASAAIICSAAKIGDSQDWHDRAGQVRRQGTPVLVDGSARRWFAPGFIARDPESTSRLLYDLSDADNASYAFLCEALADFDVREQLPAITVPTLVLTGADDGVTTTGDGQFMAQNIPGSTYKTITDAAHLAPIEQPAQVLAALEKFIKEHG